MNEKELNDQEPEPEDALPVDDPDLPEDGDSDDFEEEPVAEEDFDQYAGGNDTMDNVEEREEPNDLSDVDKEFED